MSSISIDELSPSIDEPLNIDLDVLIEEDKHPSSLDDFLGETDDRKALKYWLREYENTQYARTKDDLILLIDQSISDIDHLINDQLNIIIHNKRFQELEASWRGLWYLCVHGDASKRIKIRLFDANWKEITRDIQRTVDFDQSNLFKKIYRDEFDVPGGEPYGVLIGNYTVSHARTKNHPHDDIETLKGISRIAAASFSPFIAGVSCEFFGIESFERFGTPLNLKKMMQHNEYFRWKNLRDEPSSKFLGLTLPRMLIREPYRTTPGSYKGLFFYEKQLNDHDHYLWGNACFAFGAVLLREFANVGWFGHIRGVPRNQVGGGLITNLAAEDFTSDAPGIAVKPSTDVVITDTLERELSDLGFIPLSKCYDTPFSAFFSNQSVQKPTSHNKDLSVGVNSRLSSMLQHVLCASRVSHYIKVIIRDKIGSHMSADDCEKLLQGWLRKYTAANEDLDWETQARRPLRNAQVTVKENPHAIGKYSCIIRLVPHYQADHMLSELELITELNQAK